MTIAADAVLIDDLTSVVSRAAAAVLALRGARLDPRIKPDQSPVTAADEASEAIILDGVARLLPGLPVISEESFARTGPAAPGPDYVLVDPLDGTRELVAGRDEFTINVALMRSGTPILGIVAAPALGLIWRTASDRSAERLRLDPNSPFTAPERTAVRTRPASKSRTIVAAVSRSHLDPATEAYLQRFPNLSRIVCGSALKFCRLAEGAADVYPRLGPTYQWDVAAGHALLAAAGGAVTTPDGTPLSYRPDAMLVPGFIAWGDPTAAGW